MEELRSEDGKRKKWVNRVSELRSGGKLSIGRSSPLFLLFFSLYCITLLDFGPVQVASAQVSAPPDQKQVEVEFPCARDPPEDNCMVQTDSGTCQLVLVCTQHDCKMHSIPFISFSHIWFIQPRRSAPNEGGNVTAARNPGQVTSIRYTWLVMNPRSLAIMLPIHLHLLLLASMFATVFL